MEVQVGTISELFGSIQMGRGYRERAYYYYLIDVFYFKSKVEMLSVKLKCMDCVDKRVLSG